MSTTISEFSKNSREKVVFTLSPYKGRNYLDLRIFLVGENGGPDIASKKGLTLSVDLFPHLRKGLQEVEKFLVESGIIDREDLEVQAQVG
jgi:hypothetical protein